jgi:hypothetical protein
MSRARITTNLSEKHRALQVPAVAGMDTTARHGASSSLPFHLIVDETLALVSPFQRSFQRAQRHCFGNSAPGEFPLAANPSIVLHVLTSFNLDAEDLAHLEASKVLYLLSLVELILPLMNFLLAIGNMHILQKTCQFSS